MSYLFNQKKAQRELSKFFSNNKRNLNSFGSTVNQTFEAYVFAKVIDFYKKKGWNTEIKNPNNSIKLRLKFSTRGEPKNFSYCLAEKNGLSIQIRHQLRVDICKKFNTQKKPSNICCDIVVMQDQDITYYKTNNSLPNEFLISFGEVKHMSAFAELVASFVGLVHELQPRRLKRIRIKNYQKDLHLSPFLYVSGILYSTASGIEESLKMRGYDVDIYSHESSI